MRAVRAQLYMINIKILILVCLCLAIAACNDNHDDTKIKSEASATAILKDDGSIETRDANKKEIEALDKSIEAHHKIDKKFPGPMKLEDVAKLKLYEIESVNRQGVISLKEGPEIILEGVKCQFDAENYLAKFLSTEDDRIAFIPSSTIEQTPIPAYVWHANLNLMKDPELKDFITGPSYSALNETAITSGWCVVDNTKKHKYYDRYKALEEFSNKYGPKRRP